LVLSNKLIKVELPPWNSFDKTKFLLWSPPPTQYHSFFRNYKSFLIILSYVRLARNKVWPHVQLVWSDKEVGQTVGQGWLLECNLFFFSLQISYPPTSSKLSPLLMEHPTLKWSNWAFSNHPFSDIYSPSHELSWGILITVKFEYFFCKTMFRFSQPW